MNIGDYCIINGTGSINGTKDGDLAKVISNNLNSLDGSSGRFKIQLLSSQLRYNEDAKNLTPLAASVLKEKARQKISSLKERIETIKEIISEIEALEKEEEMLSKDGCQKKVSTIEELIQCEESLTRDDILSVIYEAVSKKDIIGILSKRAISNIKDFE